MDKAMLPIYAPDRMPYVLKEGGPVRILAVRIGGILAELWEYKKGDAAPYARLIKEDGEPTRKMKITQALHFQATLSPLEVLVVIAAIEEWTSLLSAGVKSAKTPSAVVKVNRLIMKLYNPAGRQPAHVELVFTGPEDKTELALLSPTEATVLAGTVGVIAPDSVALD